MKIFEFIYGLFPVKDYTFPEGEYKAKYRNKTYTITCIEVCRLDKNLFVLDKDLDAFYHSLDEKSFVNMFPYIEDKGLLIYSDYFNEKLDKDLKKNEVVYESISRLVDSFFCIFISIEHNYDEAVEDIIDYIKREREEEKIQHVKKIYFNLVRKMHDYITILRSPYINKTDINHFYTAGIYAFFCDENKDQITKVRIYGHDCWEPKAETLGLQLRSFFDKELSIPIEEYFMAKAKVYIRLSNDTLAIIHAIIALEIVIPKYINDYLRERGVDKNSVQDFNNKFGLSVRVKALLKIMLPQELHELLPLVGTTIKYRNRIMHEGLTNGELDAVNVDELVNACEKLMKHLAKNCVHSPNKALAQKAVHEV